MKDDPGNVVRFQPRPKAPPAPKPKAQPKAYRPNTGGEKAINWSRAPKALIIIALFFGVMWLLGGLGDLIGGVGI
jgi:hypothetical protein